MHLLIMALVLSVIYALADRFAGGGAPKLDDDLPGRAAFWAAAAVCLVGFLFGGWFGAALGLAWFGWRTPAWKLVPGASTTPVGAHEILATFVRHLLAPAGALIAALLMHRHAVAVAVCYGLWAGFATLLAREYGRYKQRAASGQAVADDPNPLIELVRGAGFGLATVVALGL